MDSSTTINPVISYIKTKMKRGTEEAMIKKITGMNPKASFGNRFRSKLRGIIPSAARDCSTYQFRCACGIGVSQ